MSTIATIGIALLGIGKALGLPIGLIAVTISGAHFGDKMSPFLTNLVVSYLLEPIYLHTSNT